MQPHRVRAIGHGKLVAQVALVGAERERLGVTLIDGLRQNVGHAAGVDGLGNAASGVQRLENVGPKIIGCGRTSRVDQGHWPLLRQAGGAPVDCKLLAGLQFFAPAGRHHLHELAGAGGGLRRIAVSAEVSPVAARRGLGIRIVRHIAAIDGGRTGWQVEIVVLCGISMHLLHADGGGNDGGIGLRGELHRQRAAADLNNTQSLPADASIHKVNRQGRLIHGGDTAQGVGGSRGCGRSAVVEEVARRIIRPG